MDPGNLLLGPPVRIVIKSERLSRLARGTIQRDGMPVKGEIGGAENDASIKKRKDSLFTASHVAAPELQMAPILLFPVLIEIKE